MSAERLYGIKLGGAIMARYTDRTAVAHYTMMDTMFRGEMSDGVLVIRTNIVMRVRYLDDGTIKLVHSLPAQPGISTRTILNGVLEHLGAHPDMRWQYDKAAMHARLYSADNKPEPISFANRRVMFGQWVTTLIAPADPSASSLMCFIE